MMRVSLIISSVAAFFAGACTSMAHETPQAAVLSETSPDIRAEITKVVSSALHGSNVLIADNSLMQTNRLIIERRPAVHKGITVLTADMPMPDHFRLMKSGDQCLLVHEQTGESYPLSLAVCKPVPGDG